MITRERYTIEDIKELIEAHADFYRELRLSFDPDNPPPVFRLPPAEPKKFNFKRRVPGQKKWKYKQTNKTPKKKRRK